MLVNKLYFESLSNVTYAVSCFALLKLKVLSRPTCYYTLKCDAGLVFSGQWAFEAMCVCLRDNRLLKKWAFGQM